MCRKCSEDVPPPNHCTCSDDDRAMVGSWITPELNKALDLGYRILQIFEVYHYDVSTENSVDLFTGENVNLFKEYVDLFLKVKTENSDFPQGCETYSQKLEYVENFFCVEGIHLDINNIEFNSAKRNVAKILLNSIYGKFAQTPGKKQTKIINGQNPSELFKIISDPKLDVVDFNVVDEDTLLLDYAQKTEVVHSGSSDNVPVAAFITGYGRLMLYELLEACGERAMYCDTDSIIYRADNASQILQVGDYLGDLTSELKNGSHITHFLATGPKSYAYISSDNETVLKYKGFTLNVSAGQQMNVSKMKDMIETFAHNLEITREVESSAASDSHVENIQVEVENPFIFRIKSRMSVNTRNLIKRYTIYPDKRIFSSDLTSLPIGY